MATIEFPRLPGGPTTAPTREVIAHKIAHMAREAEACTAQVEALACAIDAGADRPRTPRIRDARKKRNATR